MKTFMNFVCQGWDIAGSDVGDVQELDQLLRGKSTLTIFLKDLHYQYYEAGLPKNI